MLRQLLFTVVVHIISICVESILMNVIIISRSIGSRCRRSCTIQICVSTTYQKPVSNEPLHNNGRQKSNPDENNESDVEMVFILVRFSDYLSNNPEMRIIQ